MIGIEILVVPIVIILVLMKYGYKLKPPTQMSPNKPSFSLLPKYLVQYNLSSSLNSETRITDVLEKKLKKIGYKISIMTDSQLIFTRGSKLGEITFSGSKMKLKLKFTLPLEVESNFTLEYDAFAGVLFDTGDLWKVGNEIREIIQQ
ncbi:MAG: hypothetical protein ACXAC7_20780 [Candidatus Hodarchaeales archaeon]|jgi:hypothetical protein